MSIVRHIEITAESTTGLDDACRAAVEEASQTIRNIKQVYIKNALCEVDGNRIVKWRINAKLSFVVDPKSGDK
jgi:flavin-binding protein dodecin